MSNKAVQNDFSHVQDPELRAIILGALERMQIMMAQTPCISAVPLADQLNEIKKAAFDKMYKIGHETPDRDRSEEVLKAIRALQNVFGEMAAALAPMDNVRYCLDEVWLKQLKAT